VTGPNNDEEISSTGLDALDHMAERAVHVARTLKAGENGQG
jgi:hypothetical protein